MKIAIVFLDNINRAPYILRYKKYLFDFKYDLIYWNRTSKIDDIGQSNTFDMKYTISTKKSLLSFTKKAIGYWKFYKYVNKVLSHKEYDKLIIFGLNTGLLIKTKIIKQYKNKIILDIRDYWNENRRIIKDLEKNILMLSTIRIISSPAFKRFLPQYKYYIMHNQQNIPEHIKEKFNNRYSRKSEIILSCIGGVKYIDYDKKVIDKFANDMRFHLKFIGRGYEFLSDYVVSNNIKNVDIQGEFPMEETFKHYVNTDFILNLYGAGTPKLDYALSNKLYFSTELLIPIIVNKGTFMSEIVDKFSLGLSIDIDENNFKDKICDYSRTFEINDYKTKCDNFIQTICEDEKQTEIVLREFFTKRET